MSSRVPSLLPFWEAALRDVMARTTKFPRNARSSLASRIDNLGLDVFERLVEARYSRTPAAALSAANLDLEKMRMFVRMGHELRYLDHRGYEFVMRNLDEAGRMIGGWLRSQRR